MLKEGSEDDEFWAALGGKGPVNKEDDGVTAAMNRPVLEPRLFHCKISESTAQFRAFEVFNFKQSVGFVTHFTHCLKVYILFFSKKYP